MDTLSAQADAVRSAVSSVSTCSPAITALLKSLVLPVDDVPPAKTSTSRPRATASTNGGAKKNSDKKEMSLRERAMLATQVINALIKALGEAAKPPPSTPASPVRRPTQDSEPVKVPRTLRRSLSAPPTPLQPRSTNGLPVSPVATRNARSPTKPIISTGVLCAAECARVALAALRQIYATGKITLPPLQLEMAMSALIGRLVGIGLHDQAVKEMRILKRRLEGSPEKPEAAKGGKTAAADAKLSAQTFAELLNFGDIKGSGPESLLIITTQLQALQILAAINKPASVEAALPYLRSDWKSSPTNIAQALADDSSVDTGKVARQLERIAYYLLTLAPGPSTRDDGFAQEIRLSVSPEAGLELHGLGLEARLQWWKLAKHQGDAEKDVMHPLSAYLAAYVRRSSAKGKAVYQRCYDVFQRISSQLKAQRLVPARGSKSAFASICQTLATLARECGQAGAAEGWVNELRTAIDPKDSVAKSLSVAAQLLALRIKSPSKQLLDDALLGEVVAGIQGPLRGDHAELDELLNSVCSARRSAVNLLIGLGKDDKSTQITLPEKTRGLLETLVLQCPRFCVRWLGKPPGPTSSTKDFLRHEQRRNQMQEPMRNTLESAFMMVKSGLDQGRLTWELMGSILSDCMTLLEYMGHPPTAESAVSYYVRISHFYYLQFYTLRQQSKDAKDPISMRALRGSVECLKNRPSAEKEKGHYLVKLEKLAEVCKALGRGESALSALQSLRSNLLEDGVLTAVSRDLETKSVNAAWARDEKAEILSRALVSISKTEQNSTDWVDVLPEAEQAAALEHHLHFVLLKSGKKQDEITLRHPTVYSLLGIYNPTRFPIRRFRLLIHLLCLEVGRGDQSELVSVTRDAAQLDSHGPFGDDEGLAGFVPHMKAFFHSLMALLDGCRDTTTIQQSLATWQSIVKACNNKTDLERSVEDVSGLLDHLQSVADFLRMKGQESTLAIVLELCADITQVAEGPVAEDIIHHNTCLALQYSNLGQSCKAEQAFAKAQECVAAHKTLGDAVANFHLAFSEHFIAIGNFKRAEEHLGHAQSAFGSDTSTSRSQPVQKKHVVAYASYLLSILAQERGDSHHAFVYARESVRNLFQDWLKLESKLDPKKASPDTSTASDATLTLSTAGMRKEPLGQNPGPEFWKLFNALYRNLIRLSAAYAHLGMCQETLFYAEQAQKFAKCAESNLYDAHAAAWMASMFAKAANPTKSLEMLQEAGNVLPDQERSLFSAELACRMSSLYLSLKNTKGADIMLAKAEAFMGDILQQTAEPNQSADVAMLEDQVSKLKIEDKPATKPRRTASRLVAAKKPTKTTVGKPKRAPPKPMAPIEDAQAMKLRSSILVQKAESMLGKKEWSAALAVLEQVADVSKLVAPTPTGLVTMAACLMGMSMEQMAKDPVFSVIHDSTISFPAIASPHDKEGDGHSPAKTSPPKKGRGTVTRATPTEPTRVYVENLKQAQEYLLQAHAVATLSGDASFVHKISGMLQIIGLLLTATSAKSKAVTHSAHTSYSVELARNLTWSRERKAMVLEKNRPTFGGTDWPPTLSSTNPRRSSLGLTVDLFRFQKEYIDIIPKPWSVISLSLSENKHDLCITKLQAGHNPFVIRLPLERASSRDADTEVFNFQQGHAELLEIIRLADESCHKAKDTSAKSSKLAWWETRECLDLRLRDLLQNIEQIWLGGFRGIFSQHLLRPEHLSQFKRSFLGILDKYLPSRRQVRSKKTKTAQSVKVTLDVRVLELFIGLGDATAPNCDFDEELTDLLYFVVDILQFHGETNAYDEIDFDSMVVETFAALQTYHSGAQTGKSTDPGVHTILMLDRSLHAFPWESLPCLQTCAISRMPSLACLRRLLQEQRTSRKSLTTPTNEPAQRAGQVPEGHHVSFTSGTYILNPSTDLKTTEATFAGPLAKHLPLSTWRQVVGRAPTEPEFESTLSDADILLYFGHGSGAQYIRGRTIRRLDRCRSTVLLMGCSSARLTEAGDFEVYGPAWNYMMAGSPAVVGTLWDVTDRDIDRFAGRLFEEWGITPVGTFEEKETGKKKDNAGKVSLVEAVTRARDACRFRYVTAAAVAVYGIPVYVDK
ncbi:Separin [Echria macrotheca]|uniref:separase n=1 Tax=Echria macrotheca TaxID=438768 RepID=A0AAJ0B4Y5_9PEZI|nr:Separin [Echria macrotheca]